MSGRAIYATVQNGRYVIEEMAQGFPEGKRLRLVIEEDSDEYPEEPQFNDEERARLNAAIDQSTTELQSGERHTWEEVKAFAQARRK